MSMHIINKIKQGENGDYNLGAKQKDRLCRQSVFCDRSPCRHGVVYNQYKYDSLNQLIREDNQAKNATYVYTYGAILLRNKQLNNANRFPKSVGVIFDPIFV